MRRIYILSVEKDAAEAEAIADLLRRRTFMARVADPAMMFPPPTPDEITLALWSQNVIFNPRQFIFTNRAIDAWSEGKLILARLDHAPPPRGLGDVDSIDLSFAPARLAAIERIVRSAADIDRADMDRAAGAPPPSAASPGGAGAERGRGADTPSEGGRDVTPPQMGKPTKAAGSSRFSFAWPMAAVVGVVVALTLGTAVFYALPAAPVSLVAASALLWGCVGAAVAGHLAGRRRSNAALPGREAGTAPARQTTAEKRPAETPQDMYGAVSPRVFVSYSRKDSRIVYPIVEAVEAAGHDLWIDREELSAGTHWAGRIVRAIRESETVCLMCSEGAFQSDHVRREVYLADKYKRKLLPVRLDRAELPEDFEYFLVDRQWLDLTAIPEPQRGAELAAALAR